MCPGSLYHKILASLISFCFLISSFSPALGAESEEIFIPHSWGQIISRTEGNSRKEITPSATMQADRQALSAEQPLRGSNKEGVSNVVIISDLHCDPTSQRNISLILRFLNRQDYRVIMLEGSSGAVDVGLFRSMPDDNLKRRVIQNWLAKGELTGAEVAAILNPEPLTLFGVEDPALYRENLSVFKKCFGMRRHFLKRLQNLSQYDTTDKLWEDFLSGQTTLTFFLRNLMSYLNPSTYLLFHNSLILLQQGSTTNATEIWGEIETLKWIVREMSARNGEELERMRYQDLDRLLVKLIKLEMTRREWENYLELKNWFQKMSSRQSSPKVLIGDPEKILYGSSDQVRGRRLDSRFRGNDDDEKYGLGILKKVKSFERFYQLSMARELAMSKKLLNWISHHPGQNVALIVGGFHVKGIIQELMKKDISIIALAPNATKIVDYNHYQQRLMEGDSAFENFKSYTLASGMSHLAPPLKFSLDSLGAPTARQAFRAASIAFYELIWLEKFEGSNEEALVHLRAHQSLWKERYQKWLLDNFGSRPDLVKNLMKYFDDFEILSFQKLEGTRIEARVKLFGYETLLKAHLERNKASENRIEIVFPELKDIQPFSFLFKFSGVHGVLRRSLVGHFPKKLPDKIYLQKPIRDYIRVYNRAVEIRTKLTQDIDLRAKLASLLASSDRPALEELYGTLSKHVASRPQLLTYLRKAFVKRGIEADFEIAQPDDPRIQNRILVTDGKTVLIHPETRLGDILFFFPHEMVHVAEGTEAVARIQDVIMIARLKGLVEKLREIADQGETKDLIYLEIKADLLELEALDWELDLHTGRLETSREGQAFLKKHSLGRLEDADNEILKAMEGSLRGVIEPSAMDLRMRPFWDVLSEGAGTVMDKRRRFDAGLIRIFIRSSINESMKAFIMTRHGKLKSEDVEEMSSAQKLKEKTRRNVSRGFIYILISAILGGLLPILGKDLMSQFPVFSVLFIRDVIVAIVLTPFILSKKVPNPTWKQTMVIALLSIFFTVVGDPLYYKGLALSSPLAAFLIYSASDLFLLTLASRFIFHERLTWPKWVGALLTFLGATLIAWGEAGAGTGSILGSLLVFGSAIVAAAWTVMAKKVLKNVNPMVLIAITFWAGVPILALFSRGNFSPIESPMIWLFSAVTALVYILYYKGLKWISSLTVSLVDLTSPMFTALFSSFQKLKFPSLSEVGSLVLTTIGVLTFIAGTSQKKAHKRKVLEAQTDEWLAFGKDVAENLESYMTADEGITLPTVADVSELEEDYDNADILQALSYYIHHSDIPNTDVFEIIFKRLGPDRALKFILDAEEDLEAYLEGDLSDEDRKSELEVMRAIQGELGRRFSVMIRPERQRELGQTELGRDYVARAA